MKDPEGVADWAMNALEGSDRNSALYAIPWAINLHRGDDSELDWWRALPEIELQKADYPSLRSMYTTYSKDPENRIALAQAGLRIGISDPSVFDFAASTLGTTDPERGIEIFTSEEIPAGADGRNFDGIDTLFRTWAGGDPIKAGERLSAALREPRADVAILGYAQGIRAVDPEAADEWMSQIKDGAIRRRDGGQ